jgi:membrane protein DedA with SNARE-associated domain
VGRVVHSVLLIALYEAGCAIFLPLPSEAPMFLFPELSRATVLAVCAVGKGCGAYIVLASGDRLRQSPLFHSMLRALAVERAWSRLSDWGDRFMRRYGFAGFLFVQSCPGLPMRSAIYSVSLLNITAVKFAVGVAIGGTVRNVLVYGAYLGIVGLGRFGS